MSPQPPTCILAHATVLTMAPPRRQAEAVALHGSRIIAVGRDAEVLALRDRSTRLIDGRGMVIMPGFIDAHLHLRAYAGTFAEIDCRPPAVCCLADLQALLRQHSAHLPAGQWLVGYGYDEFALAERRHPTRWDLDAATPDHPVRLAHRSRHAWVCNSPGLAALGLHRGSQAPCGGAIERQPGSSEPTGLLIDMEPYIRQRLPSSTTPTQFRKALQQASQALVSAGVTTVQDASASNDLAAYEAFRAWLAAGDVGVRVALLLGIAALPEAVAAGLKPGDGSPWLRLQGIKIRLDEGSGALYPPPEVLTEQVWSAHRHGFAVAIHAVDLPALVAALRAFQQAQERLRRAELRHRIEHASLCPDACLEEFAALGLSVVTQPAFLWHHGPRYLAEIEVEQQPWLYRVKSLLDRGVPVAASSDAPVVPPLPLEGVAAAVGRRTPDARVIGPAERVSVSQALWMYTAGAAWVVGLESEVGSITPGKRADLVILEADPRRVPVEAIPQIPVRMTMIDGAVRWGSEA